MRESKAQSFIGIGPGRCGTQSLSRVVGACKNVLVSHEVFPSSWYEPSGNLGRFILGVKRGYHPKWPDEPASLIGEVSCNLLPHVQALRDPIRDLKVVCLHRPKDEVVESFLKWAFPSNMRPVDRKLKKKRYGGTAIPDVVDRFPVIDAATPRQAWEFYWEMAEEMMKMVKEPVFHMHTKSLNDDFSVKSLFDFLDIPECDRVLTHRRKWNTTQERISGKSFVGNNPRAKPC